MADRGNSDAVRARAILRMPRQFVLRETSVLVRALHAYCVRRSPPNLATIRVTSTGCMHENKKNNVVRGARVFLIKCRERIRGLAVRSCEGGDRSRFEAVSPLPSALRADLDAVTFAPMGESSTMKLVCQCHRLSAR
jgi:hypothetical protein